MQCSRPKAERHHKRMFPFITVWFKTKDCKNLCLQLLEKLSALRVEWIIWFNEASCCKKRSVLLERRSKSPSWHSPYCTTAHYQTLGDHTHKEMESHDLGNLQVGSRMLTALIVSCQDSWQWMMLLTGKIPNSKQWLEHIHLTILTIL